MNWRNSASDKSLPRSRKTPFDLGCSRDTSRGCVGRRCTVLSYTFRSHPYQNTIERGWCSKVFFGLRNNDADLSEPAIHPEGNAIHGLVEGTISVRKEGSVRGGVFAASEETCCKGKQNYNQALRRARCGGSLALELLRLAVSVRPNRLFTVREDTLSWRG